jgi:putative ABC transport system permease protein
MEELLKVAWRNLTHQRARTILTLIGVIIGIASVVALISLGNGLSAAIGERLQSLGSDKVIITPKASGTGFGPPSGGGVRLSQKDVDIIATVKGVNKVIPLLFKTYPIKYQDKTIQTSIIGVPAGQGADFFTNVQRFEIAQGRGLRSGDKNVAILGAKVSENFFDNKLKVRDKIRILNRDIIVIGILKSTGDQQFETAFIIPIETLQDLSGNPEEMTYVFAQVGGEAKVVAADIEKELENYHNDKIFSAYTTEQLTEQINSVFGILSFVLAGIAGISLVVAGFGILNTMLMSVIERTREIGIMKAVGANNKTILAMFLTESAIVGIIGGVMGVLFGYTLSAGLAGFATNFVGIKLIIIPDPVLITGVLGFAAIVGIISGTYPAYRAARLDPVEALRYE